MDWQVAFNLVFGAFSALSGWLLNTLYISMKELNKADQVLAEKLQTIEVLVAGNYIPRPEFERNIDAVFKKLDRIEDKLDKTNDHG